MELEKQILSELTHFMKYARYVPGLRRRETWHETVTRNKEMHIKKFPQLREQIEYAYRLVYDKKVLPSMRSLQFGGRAIEVNPSRMYNCSFAPLDSYHAFAEGMFLLLSGVGFGYSVQRHHVEKLPEIIKPKKQRRYLIADSIEGWADAIKILMKSYFTRISKPKFDFSDIRPKGSDIVTSGGKAPGPDPLKRCLFEIELILEQKEDGEKLTPLECHDIMCHIADAVLAGGIRRSAMISLFSMDDEDMITCKYGNWYETHLHRARANNSAVVHLSRVKEEEFLSLWGRIEASNSGEPGIYFTNDTEYGTNPCVETSLRRNTFCNLVEINGSTVESQEDFNERCEAASFINTLQASYTDFHYLREIWKRNTEKDSLIGVGITGIGSNKLKDLDLIEGSNIVKETNKQIANLIGINPAARTCVVKPSGTSSLILGTSSGIHAWHNSYYIRRIRVGKDEAIYKYLVENHPELVQDDVLRPTDTAVIEIPQSAPKNSILRDETPIELLERVRRFNLDWVRNGHNSGPNYHNVSATISIKDDEWEGVGEWMWENRDTYHGLSVLPFSDANYQQMPFEDIQMGEYVSRVSTLHDLDLTKIIEERDDTTLSAELACAGGSCTIENF